MCANDPTMMSNCRRFHDVAIFVEIYGAGLKFVFQYKWSFSKNRNFVEVGTFGPQKIATSLKLEKTAIYAH